MLEGFIVNEAPTVMARVEGKYPGAEALMFAVPRPAPVKVGCTAGAVAPPGIVMVVSERVTLLVSLLERVITTPPTGAAVERVTWTGAV